MKKLIIAFVTCFILMVGGSGFAKPLQRHTWEAGAEISHITYEEPGVMEQKGFLYGIGGSYTYHKSIMIKGQGRCSYGQVDYKNSGTMDNINDYILEFRGLGGYDFLISKASIITPYIGIGYRYLNDDASGRYTSTWESGYERESNYYYSPIGVEILAALKNEWSIGATLEYDYFWKGKQKSHLESVPGYFDIENDQDEGYGWRGSIKFQKFQKYSEEMGRVFIFQFFVRYWNIEDSEITIDPVGREWTEPKNNSTEFGVNVSVKF